jgi:hypothetical protein
VIVATVAVPVPVRFTVCGEFDAASVTVIVPVRVPAAVGVNVTLTMQFAPPFSVGGHVFVCPKSPAEPIVTDVAPVPVFLTVTGLLALVLPTACEANVKLAGVAVTVITVAVPVPVKLTVCGEFDAVSVSEIVPVRVPATVGVNVTFTVQFAPAFSVVPQLFVCAKSPVDATEMEVFAPPELVTVIGWLALVVPTACDANVSVVGAGVTMGDGGALKTKNGW